jgi:hypothetical protein
MYCGARTHACRVETRLDAWLVIIVTSSTSVEASLDAARKVRAPHSHQINRDNLVDADRRHNHLQSPVPNLKLPLLVIHQSLHSRYPP